MRFTSPSILGFYVSLLQWSTKKKRVKSKFSECPDLSCSRSNDTLVPRTSSFPAASELLRANSQSSAVVQPVRPLSCSFSPVRVQSRKTVDTAEKPIVTVVRRISVAATGIPKDKPERRNTSASLVVVYVRCKSLGALSCHRPSTWVNKI